MSIRFRCDCGTKIEVGNEFAGKQARCPSCSEVVRVPEADIPIAAAVEDEAVMLYADPPMGPAVEYHSSGVLKAVYLLALLAGLGIAFYIYLIAFDSFSETVLVQLTSVWFFPIVFGTYGLISESLIRKIESGEAQSLTEAARLVVAATGIFAGIFVLPFLVLKWRSSFLVSLVASLFWAVLLWAFFAALWRFL